MLQSMANNCMQMKDDRLETLIESLVGIVAMAYGLSSRKWPAASTTHSALLMRVRNYILTHLEDEDLDPRRIAADHGISERYLSMLFETEETTVSKWIWTQRLEASRRALSLPHFANRKINEVAYACGFNDMSHFSFSFKRRFGCPPREYRARELSMQQKKGTRALPEDRPHGTPRLVGD
jgi:AraC-like DNA-binding protein